MVQNNQDPVPSGEVIIYQTEDGLTRLSVSMENETVWLTAEQMSRLFDKAISTIREHIGHIFAEGELVEAECVRKIGISDYLIKGFAMDDEHLKGNGGGDYRPEQASLCHA